MRVLHVYSGNLFSGVKTMLVTLARHRDLCAVMEIHVALCFAGRLNDVAHVTILQRAAATTPGIVTLAGYDEADGNCGVSRISTNGVERERMLQATAVPVDAMLAACDLATIDLLTSEQGGDIWSFLHPYNASADLDEWPHMLWVMPELEPLA